jgi:hypothetical protein
MIVLDWFSSFYFSPKKYEKKKMTDRIKQISNQQTTNDYSTLISIKVPSQVSKLLIHLKEENTNAILYKIQGAQDLDFSNTEDLAAETSLTKNGSVYETIGEPWLFVRVLHKAAVADAQGKTSCVISGSGGD